MIYLLAIVLGAAWRRWWGSERPSWAFTGYRAMQAAAGFAVLFLFLCLQAKWWVAAILAGIGIGFMTLPISISRRPFERVMEKINPPNLGTWLSGPAPWGEVLEGAVVWGLLVGLTALF